MLTPTLPRHRHTDQDRVTIGHDHLVDNVLAAFEEAGRPVVLVGHSLVDGVISQVADRRPDHVARLSDRLARATVVNLDGDQQAPLTAPQPLADALHHLAAATGARTVTPTRSPEPRLIELILGDWVTHLRARFRMIL